MLNCSLITLGSELLPDFFLDEALDFSSQVDSGPSLAVSSNTPTGIFRNIKPLLNSDIVQSVGATYLFVLSGDNQGKWVLDLKNGEGSVKEVSEDATTDVTFKMDSKDMVEMFQGKLSPTAAFMAGKMKIGGDFGKATKLEKLMNQVKSKL